MADRETILRDSDFRAAGRETQREILAANDADFAQSARATQDEILASLGVDRPTGMDVLAKGIAGSGFGTQPYRNPDLPPPEAPAEAGQFAGAMAGSIAGQALGGPLLATAGAGAGGGIGRLVDVYRAYLRGEPLPASIVKDALKAAGLSAAFEGAGRGFTAAAGGALRALRVLPRPDASAVLGAFRETGVTPKVTDVTASRFPAVLERATAQTVTGQASISERVALQARQTTAAAEDYFMARLGPQEAASGVAVGQKVAEAIERSVKRSRTVENALFGEVERLGASFKLPVDNAKAMAQQLLDKEMLRPAAQRNGTLIATLKEILDVGATKTVRVGTIPVTGTPITKQVASPAEVPLKKARVWAQTFGEAVERGELISKTPTAEARAMFSALMTDIEQGVASTGATDLQAAFKTAREFATLRREIYVDSAVANVLKTDPEKVVRLVNGPTGFRRLREAIVGPPGAIAPDPRSAEAWNYVRRHIFEGVFRGATDQQAKGIFGAIISHTKLEAGLKRLGNESLDVLLAPSERAALENVRVVTKAIRAGETLASAAQSTTAQQLEAKALMTAPGAVIGGAVGAATGLGAVPGAAIGSTLSLFLTAPMLAKALTSARAVEVIASPGFARLAVDLRLAGKISREGTLALERLFGAVVTTKAADTDTK